MMTARAFWTNVHREELAELVESGGDTKMEMVRAVVDMVGEFGGEIASALMLLSLRD